MIQHRYKYGADLYFCMNSVVIMGVAYWPVCILPHPPQDIHTATLLAVTVPTPTLRPNYAMPILTTLLLQTTRFMIYCHSQFS